MKHDPEAIKAAALSRGLTALEASQLINLMGSSAIEGFDRLSIQENIDVFLNGRARAASGEAARIVQEAERRRKDEA